MRPLAARLVKYGELNGRIIVKQFLSVSPFEYFISKITLITGLLLICHIR
jgi:hypothetical protein